MDKPTNDETITFYDVPLVCGAAPEIGCGSRAKLLLIDLEQQSGIKEAWLNRTGTIVGNRLARIGSHRRSCPTCI
jgi:hypothetical protein